ncbi:hypothetical protein H9636_18460 [Ureibacillus sp. Re31]|uniref:Uncharacterized protein n=1 Tax=Ureibacillus galli TaxID=2762222 RepID=A0ABR8XHC6_9BACL|nr:hypothetical protein [Ureibacillus galli]MBD8028621.1 hypothetical protein [Ureibacillus galli]
MENKKNRFSKSIAFNKTNETDKKILEYVKRRNFSGYVKKLILADMKEKELRKQSRNDIVKDDSNAGSNS